MSATRPRATTGLVALLFGAACASVSPGAQGADPPVDRAHPAELHTVVFGSGGERMHGIVYVAAGPGPHPNAIVLHGLPGNERNLDLAQAIRRAGWNAVFFHYRGAWGSGGSFSFGNALEDVHAVISELRSAHFAAAHRGDPERIALVGHSMGGFLALTAASTRPAVDCVASLAGANPGRGAEALSRAQQAAVAQRLDAITSPLRGTSGAALAREVAGQAQRFDTTRRAPALAGRPLLLVAGLRDDVTPIASAHAPLVEALRAASVERLREVVFDADHSFSDHRLALGRSVVDWLQDDCR